MLKGYVNVNYNQQVLELYDKNMKLNDDICHSLAIKACINSNNFIRGQEIENKLSTNHGIIAKTTLIDFYSHFGYIEVAESIFNSIKDEEIDIVAINAMMNGYIINNEEEKALSLYDNDVYHNLQNTKSHILAIKACNATKNIDKGKRFIQILLAPNII